MSLITCPDCGNSVSTDAVACPNCGRPMAPAIVEPIPPREVIIQEAPKEKGFPAWMIAPIVILLAVLAFVFIAMLRNSDDDTANRNVNVRIGERETVNSRTSRVQTDSGSTDVTVPQTSAPSTVTVPPSQDTTVTMPSVPTTSSAPPTETVKVGKSDLSIEAKIRSSNSNAAPQPVQKETFYLLDKDLESILRDADIEDEEGRGLVNAFGLAVLYPEKYPEVNRKALAAINKHVIAKTLTDAQGKAKFPEVKTDSYYLFGITKTRDGFSVWNTPITLNDGQNILNLEPSGSGR